MPLYARRAVAAKGEEVEGDCQGEEVAVVTPMVVFVNSKSGGRHGPELKVRLHELISKEQVFDLSVAKPSDFVQYGLSCLERLADQGDNCAKDMRGKLRIVVAGGDGTVGWVLGCLQDPYRLKREPVPPTGIIPLGTGNDLARSFGWGGSFPFGWRSALERYLSKAGTAPIVHLDRRMAVSYLKKILAIKAHFTTTLASGWMLKFYMASTIYEMKSHILLKDQLQIRGLRNILRLYIKRVNCSEWEQIQMSSSVRSLVVLNLYNYCSGKHPWGNLKPDYLEKRGFVEAHSDDGLIEIFGLKEGWHASLVLAELIKAKHIAQAAAVKIEMRGGEWDRAYVQMDGEPWKQPLIQDKSTIVEINEVPCHSLMINGEQ